jgi:hypothetical protein
MLCWLSCTRAGRRLAAARVAPAIPPIPPESRHPGISPARRKAGSSGSTAPSRIVWSKRPGWEVLGRRSALHATVARPSLELATIRCCFVTGRLSNPSRISIGRDRWRLVRDTETWHRTVRHEPNLYSGGNVTETAVEEWLDRTGASPANAALRSLLERSDVARRTE